MKKSILWLSLVALVGLSACSTTMEPSLPSQPTQGFDLVDPRTTDMVKYQADYEQCAQLANQEPRDFGLAPSKVLNTAADKATFGLVGGKASKHADRTTVLKRCLTGRGYNVLR